jgi:hypothetical protein
MATLLRRRLRLLVIAARAELVAESRVPGLPTKLSTCPRSLGALVEEENLGKVIT